MEDLWEDVIPHHEDVLLEGTDFFSSHLVLSEKEGLNQIRIINNGSEDYYLQFNDWPHGIYWGKPRLR